MMPTEIRNLWTSMTQVRKSFHATSVAEAEAHISSVQERLWKRAMKLWIELHTLPNSNPLRREATSIKRVWKNGFQSSFQQVAFAFNSSLLEELETLQPFSLALWQERIPVIDTTEKSTAQVPDSVSDIRIAVSSSSLLQP